MVIPSARMRSTVFSTPIASHNSNGPFSQPKPQRIARSMLTTSSAISPSRDAAYRNVSESVFHTKVAARSLPLMTVRTRSPMSSMVFAASSEPNLALCRAR